jgi:hypothetical protein
VGVAPIKTGLSRDRSPGIGRGGCPKSRFWSEGLRRHVHERAAISFGPSSGFRPSPFR